MLSGSLSSPSGGASGVRKQSSSLVTSTAIYRAASSQAAYATAERSSGPPYGSSLRRYWSSSSSRRGSLVSKPSGVPSSGGDSPTRSAAPRAGVGRSSSSSGWKGGSGARAPARRTRAESA